MKKGFTLIETIVVIAVIGITLPVLVAIILTLMRQQLKINRLSQIKREGDYVSSVIGNTIKDRAFSIHTGKPVNDTTKICEEALSFSNPTTSLFFLDKSKNWFGYEISGNTIASKSADLENLPNDQTINLTSTKIFISNFSISCSRDNVYSAPSVQFSFDVCYDNGLPNCATTRPEEITSLHYQSRIKIRNY
ncbi:MAG: type II secretion system protein [Patescibacteria group bacterium]|jgi:prepilin-type N-terminal cleavage/methylation domain-containing protein